jgi:hypothetical protein
MLSRDSAFTIQDVERATSLEALPEAVQRFNERVNAVDRTTDLKALQEDYERTFKMFMDRSKAATNPQEAKRMEEAANALKPPTKSLKESELALKRQELKQRQKEFKAKRKGGKTDANYTDLIVGAANLWGNDLEFKMDDGKLRSNRFAGIKFGNGFIDHFEKNPNTGEITVYVAEEIQVLSDDKKKTLKDVSLIPTKLRNSRSLVSAIATANPDYKDERIAEIGQRRGWITPEGDYNLPAIIGQQEEGVRKKEEQLRKAATGDYTALQNQLIQDIKEVKEAGISIWDPWDIWGGEDTGEFDISENPNFASKLSPKEQRELNDLNQIPLNEKTDEQVSRYNTLKEKSEQTIKITLDAGKGETQFQIEKGGDVIIEDLTEEGLTKWFADNKIFENDSNVKGAIEEYNELKGRLLDEEGKAMGQAPAGVGSTGGSTYESEVSSTSGPVKKEPTKQVQIPAEHKGKTWQLKNPKTNETKVLTAEIVSMHAQKRGVSFQKMLDHMLKNAK